MLRIFSVDTTFQNQKEEKPTWQIWSPFVRAVISLWETGLHLTNGIIVLPLRRLGGAVQPSLSMTNLDSPNNIADECEISV